MLFHEVVLYNFLLQDWETWQTLWRLKVFQACFTNDWKKNSEKFGKIYLFDPWFDLHGVSMAFFHQSVSQDQEQFDFFPCFFGLFFEAVVLLQEELSLFLGLADAEMDVSNLFRDIDNYLGADFKKIKYKNHVQ